MSDNLPTIRRADGQSTRKVLNVVKWIYWFMRYGEKLDIADTFMLPYEEARMLEKRVKEKNYD